MCNEISAGRALGFQLGDEMVTFGLLWEQLDLYATFVKSACPAAIVYCNEGWGAVAEIGGGWVYKAMRNASRYSFPAVPAALDWMSFDLYPDDWSIGGFRAQHLVVLFAKLAGHQRALLVPPGYADSGAVNSSVRVGDCGTLDCDAAMELWANESFAFAAQQPQVIGIMPFKWRYPTAAHGRRSVGIADLPRARNAWTRIGSAIVSANANKAHTGNHSRELSEHTRASLATGDTPLGAWRSFVPHHHYYRCVGNECVEVHGGANGATWATCESICGAS